MQFSSTVDAPIVALKAMQVSPITTTSGASGRVRPRARRTCQRCSRAPPGWLRGRHTGGREWGGPSRC